MGSPVQAPRLSPSEQSGVAPSARSAGTPRITPRAVLGRGAEAFGAMPEQLLDDLTGRVGGAILDAADALEVSAVQAGVPQVEATNAVNACVDALRGSLAPRMATIRAFALRNVFVPPPTSDEPRLDRQIEMCAKRLANARALTASVERKQRIVQERADAFAKAQTALLPAQLEQAEKVALEVTRTLETMVLDTRALAKSQNEDVTMQTTPLQAPGHDDSVLQTLVDAFERDGEVTPEHTGTESAASDRPDEVLNAMPAE